MDEEQTVRLVASELAGVRPTQIKAVLQLMADGNTVPFIARYRKEATGSLDEVQIQAIEAGYQRVLALADRKAAVIKAIAEQEKLTPAIEKAINAATKLQEVEDLYLPFKQKRKTKASVARERGLAPLAQAILKFPKGTLAPLTRPYVNAKKEVPTAQAALDGAHEILAETFAEDAHLRDWVRQFTTKNGRLTATVKTDGETLDEKGVYRQYYKADLPLRRVTATQTLAINRGEKAKILTVKVQVDANRLLWHFHDVLIGRRPQTSASDFVQGAYEDAYKRFIGPAIEREVRAALTEKAAAKSITVFGANLYNLLMQAPIKGKIVMGFDPAYRTGCKLAVVDENGKFLTKGVIYPHRPAPEKLRKKAAPVFKRLLEEYQVEMIAIGNGTASRESEQFVADVLRDMDRPIYYVIVNEAGASVYSASAQARAEFPDLEVQERSAISIARRLQDPLAELVKIDPEAIGVGQYQHDLPQKDLAGEVDAVVERAVNRVGVNLNTASAALLTRISGLTKTTAANIVAYRDENGRYTNRTELKKVARLGPKAYEQAVGFLRIIGGKNPLDNTDIHPESYPVAREILKTAGVPAAALEAPEAKARIAAVDVAPLVAAGVGAETVADVVASLETPGRDLRDTMPAPILRRDVLTAEDLTVGMKLEGTVRNVVDFGAFVDIGVKHDGLVHKSRMVAGRSVADPASMLAVGDIIDVWIEAVELDRDRIALTMIDPHPDED